MKMRDLKAGDELNDSGWTEASVDCCADVLSNPHTVGKQGRINSNPVIYLFAGDHKGMTVRQRSDREKGHAEVVLPDETTWNLPVDDAREQSWHTAALTGVEFGLTSPFGIDVGAYVVSNIVSATIG